MSKVISFLFICLLFAGNISAQNKHMATIEGRVINKDGEPEAGVKVKLTQHCCFRAETTTDAYGMYQLTPGKGKYEITVKHKSGAEEKKDNLSISTGDKIKLNFFEKELKHEETVRHSDADYD
jgi:hypothetical protein